MAQTTKFPTANEADTGAGLTNPNNAHADDGSYATAAPGKNTTLGTRYLTFGFDSAIPAEAGITKVQLIYEYKTSTTASIATGRIRANVSGVNQANHDDTSEPASDTVITVDATADRSWVRADLLDANFKVGLLAVQGNSSTAVTFSFDYVKVTVDWEPVEVLFPQNRMFVVPIRI